MRRVILALLFAAGCAASTAAPDGGGVDMTINKCDPKTLFSSCSQQCQFHVCFVGSANCELGQWTCDCAQASACATDGGPHD